MNGKCYRPKSQPIFSEDFQTEWCKPFDFSTRISGFPKEVTSIPLVFCWFSVILDFFKKDTSLRTNNGHLKSAFCSKKIPQNRNVGAVHDSKLQIVLWYFVPFLQFAGCARGGSDLGVECRVGNPHPPPPNAPTPPKMTCEFLIQLVFCKKKSSCFICVEVNHETRLKNKNGSP